MTSGESVLPNVVEFVGVGQGIKNPQNLAGLSDEELHALVHFILQSVGISVCRIKTISLISNNYSLYSAVISIFYYTNMNEACVSRDAFLYNLIVKNHTQTLNKREEVGPSADVDDDCFKHFIHPHIQKKWGSIRIDYNQES